MDTIVSPRIRLLALVALLAALAFAAAMLVLSRAQADAAAGIAIPPPAVVKAAPEPARAVRPRPRDRAVAADGLPRAIAAQLARHELVVAAVYARGAAVDRLARDEAEAGADDARAGFVAVDVSDPRVALALAERTALLAAPAVLVFARDGQVRARLEGFADRRLVAELAEGAR